MRFVLYTHSLVSDWNHGNAHFQRGILRELASRGHEVLALEPADGWSRENLVRDQGSQSLKRLARDYPELQVLTYDAHFDHADALDGADIVLVHEWTSPHLIEHLGRLRVSGGRFLLLFHDTHHRAVSAHAEIASLTLQNYDAVLAFGEALRERYLQAGWGKRVYTWHEAADTSRFRPLNRVTDPAVSGQVVWIGNWGDNERARELEAFLIEPARALDLSGSVYGVRYPKAALTSLERTRLVYRGWLANADVPEVFAQHRVTIHVPRRPYVESLPGIPTIRVFEALACGIPLVCTPWQDCEGLFRPGEDYLVARNPEDMKRQLTRVLEDTELADALARSGLERVHARHTCRHRVDELLSIVAELNGDALGDSPAPSALIQETVP